MGTDRCAYGSPLRRLDPVAKVMLLFLTLPLCLAGNGVWVGVFTCLAFALLNLLWGKQSLKNLLHYFTIPMGFLVIGCMTIILRPIGEAEALWSVRLLGQFRWGITAVYLQMGISVFCKAMGAVSAMYFLSMNTPMTDLSVALGRLHVPKLMIELMELIYRFIFLLFEETERVCTAQKSRLGFQKKRDTINALGEMAATIFLRALRRGDRVYAALESRGYSGDLTTLAGEYEKGGRCYVWGGMILLVQLVLFLVERSGLWAIH